jgi:hypothetical protein
MAAQTCSSSTSSLRRGAAGLVGRVGLVGLLARGAAARDFPGRACTGYLSAPNASNVFAPLVPDVNGNPPCADLASGVVPVSTEERHACYRKQFWDGSEMADLPDAFAQLVGTTYPSKPSVNGATGGANFSDLDLHKISFYDCASWLDEPYPNRWSQRHAQCGTDTMYSAALIDPRTGAPLPPKCLETVLAFQRANENKRPALQVGDPYENDYVNNNTDATFPTLLSPWDISRICKALHYRKCATCSNSPPVLPGGGGVFVLVSSCKPATDGTNLWHGLFLIAAYAVAQPLGYLLELHNPRAAVACYTLMGMCVLLSWFGGVPPGRAYPGLLALLNVTSAGFATLYTLRMCAPAWFQERARGVRESTALATVADHVPCTRLCAWVASFAWRWARFLSAVVLAYIVLALWLFRFMGTCRDDGALFVASGNMCPGHFGIGSMFGVVGILNGLLEFKMITMSITLAQMEFMAQVVLGTLLLFFTQMVRHFLGRFPLSMTTLEYQHTGLYLIQLACGLLGLLVHRLGIRPKTWNAPSLFGFLCIAVLLWLHDPDSHGIHKQLHQMAAVFMAVMMISRSVRQRLVASVAGCLAGMSFFSVVFVPMLEDAVHPIDYLGWFFYEVIVTLLVHVVVLGVGFAAKRLGKPDGDGEPSDDGESGGGGGGGDAAAEGKRRTARGQEYELVNSRQLSASGMMDEIGLVEDDLVTDEELGGGE